MPLRLCAAVWAGKTVAALSRMLGYRGSSLPGHVALRIYSGTLKALARRARKGVVLVTGTNGKTTTNNMIAQVLTGAGYSVIINREGANMLPGIATAFVRGTGVNPAYAFDYAVLEVDEASFPRMVEQVKPDLVVVT
nr:Mur ligase family protein [Clostridia bacterium]